jgi:hypothetical protein
MRAAKTTARIERMSQRAAALLQQHPALLGRIHSRYARILNIETPNGELLTLQGPGVLQAPCAASLGVHIDSLPARLVPGDLVAQSPRTRAAMHLTSASATLWDGRLAPLPDLSGAARRTAAARLSHWVRRRAPDQGIAPVLDAFNGTTSVLQLHRRFCDALAPMFASRNLTAAAVEAMAAQVIGLGDGLTPSGDDLLVGFLAVWRVAGRPPVRLGTLAAQTTDLSAAFLHCALDGHFSEPLARFMRALYGVNTGDWQVRAADLARVGHSSGVDAMVGIAIASQVLAADID